MSEQHVEDCAEDGTTLEGGDDATSNGIGRIVEVGLEVADGDCRGDNTAVHMLGEAEKLVTWDAYESYPKRKPPMARKAEEKRVIFLPMVALVADTNEIGRKQSLTRGNFDVQRVRSFHLM